MSFRRSPLGTALELEPLESSYPAAVGADCALLEVGGTAGDAAALLLTSFCATVKKRKRKIRTGFLAVSVMDSRIQSEYPDGDSSASEKARSEEQQQYIFVHILPAQPNKKALRMTERQHEELVFSYSLHCCPTECISSIPHPGGSSCRPGCHR
jgi:ribonucleotide reductase alpha subunit